MSGRVGLRPERRHSGACLTIPASAGCAARLAIIRVGARLMRTPVAKPCRRRSGRLHDVFLYSRSGLSAVRR
jgi:hypothetical protein